MMFIWNHHFLWKSYPKMNDPHFCTRCGRELEKVRRAEVVEKGSELELELIRSYNITGRALGRTKYHWTEYHCPGCGVRYSIDAVRKMEEER